MVCLHNWYYGGHPACLFIDRAGKVATPDRNLAGKHSFHLVYLPFCRAPTGERQEIFGVHAELGAMFAGEPAYFAQ